MILLLLILFLIPSRDRVSINSVVVSNYRTYSILSDSKGFYKVPAQGQENPILKTECIETTYEWVQWKDNCKYTLRDTVFHYLPQGQIGQYLKGERWMTSDKPKWESLP